VAELRELLSRRRELVWTGREVRKEEDILSRGRMQCGMHQSLSESRVMAGRLEKQAAASPWTLDSDAGHRREGSLRGGQCPPDTRGISGAGYTEQEESAEWGGRDIRWEAGRRGWINLSRAHVHTRTHTHTHTHTHLVGDPESPHAEGWCPSVHLVQTWTLWPSNISLHWPWLDGGAVPAHAARGRHVGGGFLGQQVPAGIVAKVACRVRWIQDDGPAIAITVRLIPGNIGVSS